MLLLLLSIKRYRRDLSYATAAAALPLSLLLCHFSAPKFSYDVTIFYGFQWNTKIYNFTKLVLELIFKINNGEISIQIGFKETNGNIPTHGAHSTELFLT